VCSELQPYMLKGSITSKPSEVQQVETGRDGKDRMVWCSTWPSQGC